MYLRTGIVFISGCVIGVLGMTYYDRYSDQQANAFFAQTLTSAGVAVSPDVDLETLRLLYAKTVTERNPFMAFPGTDLTKLRAAIDQQIKARETMAQFQKTKEEEQLVWSSLYPIDFLQAVFEAEVARRMFLATSTPQTWRSYREALSKAFAEYDANNAQFTDTFEKVVPKDVSPYATAQKVIERQDMVRALTELRKGAKEIDGEYKQFVTCVEGSVRACDIARLKFQRIELPNESGYTPGTAPLSVEIRNLLMQSSIIPQEVRDYDEVLVTPLQNVCASTQNTGVATFETYMLPIREYTRILDLSDIRFVRSAEHAASPFFGYFATHNKEFVYASPFTYYTCPEINQDLESVLGVLAVRRFVREHSVASFAPPTLTTTILSLEKKLATTNIHEHDAREYLYYVESFREALPPALQRIFTELELTVRLGTADFDAVISSIGWTEQVNIPLHTHGVTLDTAPEYLFYVRSGIFLLLASQNQSVSGVHPSFFKVHLVPPAEQPYTFYSLLPRTAETRRTILENLTFYRDLHH